MVKSVYTYRWVPKFHTILARSFTFVIFKFHLHLRSETASRDAKVYEYEQVITGARERQTDETWNGRGGESEA